MKISVALGGGGTKAAFGVGVLKYLHEQGHEIEAITGTSAGALNGILISLGKFNELLSIWGNPKLKDIFMTPWTFGIAEGFFKKGLFQLDGIEKLIRTHVTEKEVSESKINFGCVYTDYHKSEKVTYYSKNSDYETLIKSIMASMALTPAYPPVQVNDRLGIDGGYTEGVPVESLMPLVKDSEKILVILADYSGSEQPDPFTSSPKNLIDVFLRQSSISIDTVFDYNVKYGRLKYWDQDNKFIVVKPNQYFVESALDFNSAHIAQTIQYGYLYASRNLENLNG